VVISFHIFLVFFLGSNPEDTVSGSRSGRTLTQRRHLGTLALSYLVL
jgi:hypothetical protein